MAVLRRLLILAILVLAGAYVLGAGADGSRDGRVLRIVDGDTLHVRSNGRDETVRIVGIDTPERGACGFDGATGALRELVGGGRVALIRDRTQDRRDRYGRLLAYVERDGVDVGRRLVGDGWAAVYVFDGDPFQRVDAYRSALDRARAGARGVHGGCP